MTSRPHYRLYNEDAFSWLSRRKARSVHAIVTDPPYGIVEFLPDQLDKRRNGNGGIWRLPMAYDGVQRSPLPRFTVLTSSDHVRIADFHSRLATHAYRVLVPGAHVIVASQVILSHLVTSGFVSAGFQIRGQVARIVKTLRGGDRPKGAHKRFADLSVSPRSCWEPWLVFRKPCEGTVRNNLKKWGTGALRRPEPDKPFSDLIPSSPARGAERTIAPHPSLKPQAFMRQLVWASLPLGKGVILDPFMGAGSTVAAAAYFGYYCIGIETDAEYFTLAVAAIPALAALQPNGSNSPSCPTTRRS
jgi:site-specific DNA-methyltransferase (adenine-specific)